MSVLYDVDYSEKIIVKTRRVFWSSGKSWNTTVKCFLIFHLTFILNWKSIQGNFPNYILTLFEQYSCNPFVVKISFMILKVSQFATVQQVFFNRDVDWTVYVLNKTTNQIQHLVKHLNIILFHLLSVKGCVTCKSPRPPSNLHHPFRWLRISNIYYLM